MFFSNGKLIRAAICACGLQ